MPGGEKLYRADSIGKAENPYDVYAHVKNPRSIPPKPEVKLVDAVESQQQKLEREALKLFREGTFKFSQMRILFYNLWLFWANTPLS